MLWFCSVFSLSTCLIFLAILPQLKADYYSSVVGLESLLIMEENFISAVEDYISNVHKVQKKIESFLDETELEQKRMNKSGNNYFEDPINAFSIIKRLVVDWKHYGKIIAMENEFRDFTKPTVNDLQGAARGLLRLQEMYQLDTSELAMGNILGYKYSEELSVHDCYVMGVALYNSSEFLPASEWFMQALEKLDDILAEGVDDPMENFPFITYVDILEYLHVALFYGGNLKLAKYMNQQLLIFDPDNRIGLANKALFEKAVIEERRLRTINNPPKKSELNTLYNQVCRGELSQTDAEMRNLHCRYVTNNIPYYFIGPFKMEELNHEPFVAFYHQAIYDGEIDQIKKAVGNNVVRSLIGSNQLSEKRTSKQSWLYWDKHKFLNKIYQRLEDITGLSMSTGEAMQVANYGIGATMRHIMILQWIPFSYLINDVELGGATAFPFLRLAVPPIKNSLVLWYNEHNSTEVDYRTRHAGCPVLKGSKWTTTTLLLATLNIISPISSCVNAEVTSSSSSSLSIGQEQDELYEMLNTEKVLIDTLRHYIETQENKLNFLKRKTSEIRNIHDGVTDREKYLYNPINALTILKRFTADWKSLKSYAEEYLNTEDLAQNYSQQIETLTFPTDQDYDAALINLLRIQDMYQLEPQRLAVGEVNGVKLGSEMTWSDCLEIGLKSSKNGYQTYAKYWMETALEKLPNSHSNDTNEINSSTSASATTQQTEQQKSLQDDYTVKAKLEIMTALLNTEYKLGNLEDALKIANEMLKLKPKQKNVKKAKEKMENELKKLKTQSAKVDKNNEEKQKRKTTKTAEELMIEEICREGSNLQNNKQIHSLTSWNPSAAHTPSCAIVTNNLPFLLLQPLNIELLSLDPYIVIYHNILSDSEIEELKDFVVEEQDDTFQFTRIGQKKMRQINGKLHYVIGHYGQNLYDDWQVERYNFENLMELENSSVNYGNNKQAKVLVNLQQPLMGGSVIFPQLELSINLPNGSMLYWSQLNEFHAYDYRSNYHVCPVIGGSQLSKYFMFI
ncbi:hypothetical protein FF38_00113 [Lucilia cuprina]|uniref:Prolyl 4-hydroxylase alpha subunit domain-containing protein n=1 Tax=Lucilia cuprina TaxID=7375 RepID=A0A0L0BL55_LUCCU|nr:hypothetical protein FF38_00113 [Lucilia cuprina]